MSSVAPASAASLTVVGIFVVKFVTPELAVMGGAVEKAQYSKISDIAFEVKSPTRIQSRNPPGLSFARHHLVMLVIDERQHPDRHLFQVFGAVWNYAVKGQAVTRFQTVHMITVAIVESSFQDVDELHSRV